MIFRHSFAASFGKAGLEKKSTVQPKTPGPAYFPKVELTSGYSNSPRATIGHAPRSFSVGRQAAAADAVIELPKLETICAHSFHASFGTEKRTQDKKETGPGPLTYDTTKTSMKQASFASRLYISLSCFFLAPKPSSTRGTFSHSKRGAGAWIFS